MSACDILSIFKLFISLYKTSKLNNWINTRLVVRFLSVYSLDAYRTLCCKTLFRIAYKASSKVFRQWYITPRFSMFLSSSEPFLFKNKRTQLLGTWICSSSQVQQWRGTSPAGVTDVFSLDSVRWTQQFRSICLWLLVATEEFALSKFDCLLFVTGYRCSPTTTALG
jgi:hypothetical protein